ERGVVVEVIKYTQEEIESNYASFDNLSSLIKGLEKETADSGRVICQVEVNGLKMTEIDEETFGSTPVRDVKELIIQTENVSVLIQASIASVREWMERLKHACVSASESYRDVPTGQEQKEFSKLMEAYRELIQTLGVLQEHIGGL